MLTQISNNQNILSLVRGERNNGHDISFQCKDGIVEMQSVILVAASNFWKEILEDIPDVTIATPDIEKHVLISIFSLLYDGFVSNSKNILCEANIILPDLVFDITDEGPNEVLIKNVDKEEESEMDERTCKYCFKYFSRKEHCLNHMDRMHTGKDNFFKCEICEGNFKTKQALNIHIQVKHVEGGPISFECLTCGKCYAQEPSLKRHARMNKHQYKLPSPIPKQGYQNCKICGKQVGRLSYHMDKYHKSEDLTFPCKKCDKKFGRKDVLYRHEERVHSTFYYNLPAANQLLKIGEKEWKCKICEKEFHTALDLENHLVNRKCSGKGPKISQKEKLSRGGQKLIKLNVSNNWKLFSYFSF